MKKLFILLASLATLFSFAQNDTSLLYKISGKDLAKPSYIFGTIHISCDATIDAATKKALEETNQMYLELDMDDPEMQNKMMATIGMKDGVTLKSLLSDSDYQILDVFLQEKMKVPASAFNNYKPFVLSSYFLPSLLDCTPQSFETELVKISNLQNEPVFGLETIEEQMTVFDKISYKVQAEELMKSIKNDFKEDKIELNKLTQAYANKDITEMQKLISNSSNKLTSDYDDLLLTKRNENWVKMIPNISKENPTFYGVGAAHLFGKNGVIELLRAEGFRVDAVKN